MKIVISSQSFHSKTNQLRGYEIIYNEKGRRLTDTELTTMMNEYVVGIIAGGEPITKKVMDAARNLKAISRIGIGIDNIDIDYAKERGIKVLTVSSHVDAVAEHTLALILASIKNITNDRKEMGALLKGKSVGIIGHGKVGQRLEELLVPFGVTIHRCDIVDKGIYKYISLAELLKKSDIVTIHCPLTNQTRGMIGFEEFNLMKVNVLLVNTARAEIINELVLLTAIKSKMVNAALDVVKHPERFKDLGVIITPHTASYTYETRRQMENDAMRNIIQVI